MCLIAADLLAHAARLTQVKHETQVGKKRTSKGLIQFNIFPILIGEQQRNGEGRWNFFMIISKKTIRGVEGQGLGGGKRANT